MLNKTGEFFGISIALSALIGFVILVLCIGPVIVWMLWNYLSPSLRLPNITFIQSIAIYILGNMLTGGFINHDKSK